MEINEHTYNISIVKLIKSAKREWKIVVSIFLISIFAGLVVFYFSPKTYSASALIKLGNINNTTIEIPQELSFLLEHDSIREKILTTTAKSGRAVDLSKIKMKILSGYLRFTSIASSPTDAVNNVNGVSQAVMSYHRLIIDQKLKRFKNNSQKQKIIEKFINILEKRIDQLEAIEKNQHQDLSVRLAVISISSAYESRLNDYYLLQDQTKFSDSTENATFEYDQLVTAPLLPQKQNSPNLIQNIVISLLIGSLISLAYIILMHSLKKDGEV